MSSISFTCPIQSLRRLCISLFTSNNIVLRTFSKTIVSASQKSGQRLEAPQLLTEGDTEIEVTPDNDRPIYRSLGLDTLISFHHISDYTSRTSRPQGQRDPS